MLQLEKNHYRLNIGALLVGLICAYFSVGFWHPDEYFQLLPYLEKVMTGTSLSLSELPEWKYQMRGAFHPLLFAPHWWLVKKLGLPFDQFFLYARFSVFLFAFWVFQRFLRSPLAIRPEALLIWFVPFLLVRLSTDTLGSLFFLAGYSYWIKNRRSDALIAGAFFGGMLLLRYHLLCVALPLLVFHLLNKRDQLQLFMAIMTTIIVFSFEGAFNYLLYDELVFSSWNHLEQNLIHGMANQFGTSPFYFYLAAIFKGIPPVSLFLLACLYQGFFDQNKKELCWIALTVLLMFSCVAHKEWRFPTLSWLIMAWIFSFKTISTQQYWRPWIIKGTVMINLAALCFLSLKPAYRGSLIYREISKIKEGQTFITPQKEGKPLELKLRAYFPKNSEIIEGINYQEMGSRNYFLVTDRFFQWQSVPSKCKRIKQTYPDWLISLNPFNFRDRSNVWALWNCS